MELSAEILHATLANVRMELTHGRKHARVPLRFKIRITPYEDAVLGTPVSVWTRDVSLGGLGLILNKSIKPGRHFIIRLPREEDTGVVLLCTVRSCTQVAAGVYNAGASFVEVPESPAVDHSKLAAAHFQPEAVSKETHANPSAATTNDPTSEEIKRISSAILF